MLTQFNNFHFDWSSAVLTIIALPLIYGVLRIVAKHSVKLALFIAEGAVQAVARYLSYSITRSFSVKKYCRLQLNNEATKLLYIPAKQPVIQEVDRCFITLSVSHPGADQSYDHNSLLTAGNRLVVVGDPGSGKSSLLKRVLRSTCRAIIANLGHNKLPVLVQLKEIHPPNTEEEHWLLKKIRLLTIESSVYGLEEAFDRFSETSGLLLLLDGLDEIASSEYDRFLAGIIELSDWLSSRSGQNQVILTSRSQFFQRASDGLRSHFPTALYVQPFSPTNIYTFLTRWPGLDPNDVARIYRNLSERPSLREMCTNPLVLSMYVAEDSLGSAFLPETRTEFYRNVCEELLIRRRLRQDLVRSEERITLQRNRERVFGKLAFEHLLDQSQAGNSLSYDHALRITAEVHHCTMDQAGPIFFDMAKETGLISEERTGQSFRFIHLTFCEFFAASEAALRMNDGWEQLLEKHTELALNHCASARLAEVIPFTVALLPLPRQSSAIRSVSDYCDFSVIANTFLEAKVYEEVAWETFIAKANRRFSSIPEQGPNEAWLSEIHLFSMVLRDKEVVAKFLGGVQLSSKSKMFEVLFKSAGSSLENLLSGLARRDAAAAMSLASSCGIHLTEDYPEVVSGSFGSGSAFWAHFVGDQDSK